MAIQAYLGSIVAFSFGVLDIAIRIVKELHRVTIRQAEYKGQYLTSSYFAAKEGSARYAEWRRRSHGLSGA